MERMFFLTLVPHENSPPTGELMEQLRRLLSRLGTLHEFGMVLDGRLFRAKLCAKHTAGDLLAAFTGMTVNAQVQEEEGGCHDCRTMAA